MNITILANHDLASNIALNYLVDGLTAHRLSIFVSDQVGHNKAVAQPLLDLKFFEQTLFNEIVYPAADRHSSTNKRLCSFYGLANRISGTFDTLNDVNEPQGLARLVKTKPDLILSIRFGKILKAPAIASAPLGIINLHSGLLPQYQGVMATFWAMLNGDKEYGSTLHFIDSAAIDAGPIIKLNPEPLDLSISYLENVLHLYQKGCTAMIEATEQIASGQRLQTQKTSAAAQYYSFPQRDDLQLFFERGYRLFDSQKIMAWVKAYQGDE